MVKKLRSQILPVAGEYGDRIYPLSISKIQRFKYSDKIMSNLIQLPKSSDSECPTCGSTNTVFDTDHGFHKCNTCEHVWGLGKDDPDYDECDDELEVFDHEQGNWKKIRVKADEY